MALSLLTVPLPRGWSEHVRSGALQALALAHFVATHVRGWCLESRITRVRLAAQRDIALSKVAVLQEEARILRARIEHLCPQRRPHYPPPARLAILALRAACGWTVAETARRFQVSPQTIANWMQRLGEHGETALVRMPEPVNRFPDFVRQIVLMLDRTFPTLGKVRIADILARAGLHLAVTTIARIRKSRPTNPTGNNLRSESSEPPRARAERTVTARYPHHVWHIDLTLLPLAGGFWVPWIPQALVQRWPFSFWLGAVLDHHSRAIVGWRLFRKEPSAREITCLLDAARRASGATPKYIVSDRGTQFQTAYRAWCRRREIRPRFGAVGKSGSIAVIERFFRSLKEEMLGQLRIVPMAMAAMAREVTAYLLWYNEHRPHQGLQGKTPAEMRDAGRPARDRRPWEPRPRYPLARGHPKRRARRVKRRLVLDIERVDGRDQLPIVELRHAA